MQLDQAIAKAREQLVAGGLTEAAVSQGPIKRVLASLGWDVFDTATVVPEFSVGPRRVDYALKSATKQVAVFVEVKAPGKADSDADRQLFEYAFHEGVPLALLTDGRVWNFYLPAGQGSYEERRFLKLDLLEQSLDYICSSLERYLDFARVKSGEAQAAAVADYNEKFKSARLRDYIPVVWERLLRETDPALVDLISDEVEEALGQRPVITDVTAFLKTRVGKGTNPLEVTKQVPVGAEGSVPSVRSHISHQAAGIGYSIKGGPWKECRSGRQAYVQLIEEFSKLNAGFLARFSEVGHGKKRAWVAKDPELLFPGRQDLQSIAIHPLFDGWLLGLNISAEIEMPRRAEVACAVLGLVLGKDVQAKFK